MAKSQDRHYWTEIIITFYIQELNPLTEAIVKGRVLSTFLLAFENFFLVCCGWFSREDSLKKVLDTNSYLISIKMRSYFIYSQNILDNILSFVLYFNLFIILLIFVIFILSFQELNQQRRRESLRLLQFDQEKINTSKGIISILLGVLLSCYRQAMFPLFTFISLSLIKDPSGGISFILTLIIGIFVTDIDFSYSYDSQDYLSRPYSSLRQVVLLSDIICILGIIYFNQRLSFIVLDICFLIKIIIEIFITAHWSWYTRQVLFTILLMCIGTSIILIFEIDDINIQKISTSNLILVLVIPFGYSVSSITCKILYSNLKIMFLNAINSYYLQIPYKQINLESIDRIIRREMIIDSDSFKQQDHQAIFFLSSSFKQEDNFNTNYILDVLQIVVEKNKIIDIIAGYYSDYVRSSKMFHSCEICLQFLLQKQFNYRLFWFMSEKAKRELKISLKQKQLIYSVSRRFKSSQEHLNEFIQRNSQSNEQMNVSTEEQQNSNCELNPFYEGYLDVVVFEGYIQQILYYLEQSANLKMNLLEMIKGRYLNAPILLEKIEQLDSNNNLIREELMKASLLNADDSQLNDLKLAFMKSLAFSYDEEGFMNKLINSNNKLQKDKTISLQSDLVKLFKKDQCILFALLEESFNLKILKATRNTKQVLNQSPSDILFQQVTELIPQKIKSSHSTYVKQYLTETDSMYFKENKKNKLMKQSSQLSINDMTISQIEIIKKTQQMKDQYFDSKFQIIRMKDKLIFGAIKNQKCPFLVNQLQISVKLNTLFNPLDSKMGQIGFSALIKNMNQNKDYILFSLNNFQTIGITQNIYQNFKKINSDLIVNTDNFNFESFFPFLTQNNQVVGQDKEKEIQIWKNLNSQKYQNEQTCIILIPKRNVLDFPFRKCEVEQIKQKSQEENQLNHLKNQKSYQQGGDNMIQTIFTTMSNIYSDHNTMNNLNTDINLIQNYRSSNLIQLKSNNDSHILNSNKKAIKTSQFHTSISLPISHKSLHEEDVITNIEQISPTKRQDDYQNNKIESTTFFKKKFMKNGISNFGFFYAKLKLKDLQYPCLPDYQALEISELIEISPNQHGQEIKEELEIYFSSYSLFYPKEILEQLQEDLQCLLIKQSNFIKSEIYQEQQNKSFKEEEEEEEIEENCVAKKEMMSSLLQKQKVLSDNHYLNKKLFQDISQNTSLQLNLEEVHKKSLEIMQTSKINQSSNHIYSNSHEQLHLERTMICEIEETARKINSNCKVLFPSTMQDTFFNETPKKQKIVQTDRFIQKQCPKSHQNNNKNENKLNRSKFSIQNPRNICIDKISMFNKQFQKQRSKKSIKKSIWTLKHNNDDNDDNDREDDLDSNELNKCQQSNELPKAKGNKGIHIEREHLKSKNSSLSDKTKFVKFINGNENPSIISIIKFIGYSCFLIMILVTLFNYFIVKYQLDLSFEDNSFYVWPMKYSSCYSDLFRNQYYLTLLKQGDFSTSNSFPTSALKVQYIQDKKNDFYQNGQCWKKYVAEEYRVGERRSVFKLMNQQNYTFRYSKSFNQTSLVGVSSLQSGFAAFYFQDVLLNSGPSLSSWILRLIKGLGTGRSEYYLTKNVYSINESLIKIQALMKEQNNERGQDISRNLSILIILVVSLSFITLSLMIPLYYIIQVKKQSLLELFKTFSLSQIESLMKQISIAFLSSKVLIKSIKNLPQPSHKTLDIKRQPLGAISQLPKFNKWIISIAILTQVFIISGPIINLVLTMRYLQISENLMQVKYNLQVMKGFMQNILQLNYLGLILKIEPQSKIISLDQYMDDIQSQFNLIEEKKDSLKSIIQMEKSLMQIKFVNNRNQFYFVNYFLIFFISFRSNSNEFRTFFFPVIEGNMCEILERYPQYLTPYMKIILFSCNSLKFGLLTKGYQASLFEFFSIFPTFYQLFNLTSPQEVSIALQKINNQFDIKIFSDFDEFLEEVVEVLDNFLVEQEKQEHRFIDNFQFGVLIYDLVMKTLVFLIGWYKFTKYLKLSLIKTKKLLRVIDITNLMSNNYILAFVKANSFQKCKIID